MDRSGELAQLGGVLASVVGAEQQFSATWQLDTYVGLRATAVTPIESGELWARCDRSVHVLPPFQLVADLAVATFCTNIQPGSRYSQLRQSCQ
jgi:hypothetical protein